MSKKRIIELQKQVRIAREALTRIGSGNYTESFCVTIASEALDKLWALDEKQPLQGVVGHGFLR